MQELGLSGLMVSELNVQGIGVSRSGWCLYVFGASDEIDGGLESGLAKGPSR